MKRCFFSLFIVWLFFYLCGCYTASYINAEEAAAINQDIYFETAEKTYIYLNDDVVREGKINKKGDWKIFLQNWINSGDSLILYYNTIKYIKKESVQDTIPVTTDSLVISKSQIIDMYYKEFNAYILIGLILTFGLVIYGIAKSVSIKVGL